MEEDLEELMQEPPGGVNHGRRRGRTGWVPLEPTDFSLHGRKDIHEEYPVNAIPDAPLSIKRRAVWHESDVPHGNVSGYVYRKCRCDDCKAAWAAYMKARRVG